MLKIPAGKSIFLCGVALALFVPLTGARAATETVLYSFSAGNDGGYPQAGLIRDKAGNLYGMTDYGGTDNLGTVFELAPNGTQTVLHSFHGGADGENPHGYEGLIMDRAGNLYDTTVDAAAGIAAAYRPAAEQSSRLLRTAAKRCFIPSPAETTARTRWAGSRKASTVDCTARRNSAAGATTAPSLN